MKEWKKRSLELYQYMPMAIKQWRHWVKAKGRQTIPQKSLGFELHVCEQCNLKCRGCDNFSCLVKENNFYDINVFRKDLLRLKELFENHVERITLLGGEPLLNPELGGYLTFARETFPHCELQIVSNGTLIMKQDDALWDTCKETAARFMITKYPIPYDYEKALIFLQQKGVDASYAYGTGETLKTLYVRPLNIRGTSDPRKEFTHCGRANGCISLKNGYLYTCTFIPNIYAFNEAFGTKLDIGKSDGINIYEDGITADAIMKFLATPVQACRYCDNFHWRTGMKWETSKGKIGEWM